LSASTLRRGRLGLGLADARPCRVAIWRCRLVRSTVSWSHQRDAADAGAGQVQRRRRAQAAGAHHQRVAAEQPLLAFDAQLVQQDVARL
jgi:hypothetical protein